MQMAKNALLYERRDILVLVMLENIPDDIMPRLLRKMLLTEKYLKWPENEAGRHLFWKEVKLQLRSKVRVNRVIED